MCCHCPADRITVNLSKTRIYISLGHPQYLPNHTAVSSLLIGKKKTHRNILLLKYLKMFWNIVYKQQNCFTNCSAYIRIEKLIEPVLTRWNFHHGTHLCNILERTCLVCLLYFPVSTNGSLWQHVEFAQTIKSVFSFAFLLLIVFELYVGKINP